MRIYWATFFVGDVVVVKQVQAHNEAQARDLAARFETAASRATSDIYAFIDVYEDYPSMYVLNEARVSDLEFLSRKMKGGP